MNDIRLSIHAQLGEQSWVRRPTIMAACALFMLATMAVWGSRVLNMLLLWVWPHWNAAHVAQLVSALTQLALVLLPVMVYRQRHDGVDGAFRMRSPSLPSVFITFAAAGCGLLLTNQLGDLWLVLLQSLGIRQFSAVAVDNSMWGSLSATISLCLIPAVSEELLFRGAIMGAWERWGTNRALVLSSVLFAVLHGSVAGLPVQLLQGFVIGYLVVSTDSLYNGMLYHFVHNAGQLALGTIAGQSLRPGESLYYAMGGAAGVLKTALTALLLGVLFVVLLMAASSEREQQGRPFERPGPIDPKPIRWDELLVLLSGLVACFMQLFANMLSAMRYI